MADVPMDLRRRVDGILFVMDVHVRFWTLLVWFELEKYAS